MSLIPVSRIGSLTPTTSNVKKSVKVWISYMEIYNENVNDLISVKGKNLTLSSDKGAKVTVEGLTKHEVKCPEALFQLLLTGNENRKVASTSMNDTSSRSHTVFRIEI